MTKIIDHPSPANPTQEHNGHEYDHQSIEGRVVAGSQSQVKVNAPQAIAGDRDKYAKEISASNGKAHPRIALHQPKAYPHGKAQEYLRAKKISDRQLGQESDAEPQKKTLEHGGNSGLSSGHLLGLSQMKPKDNGGVAGEDQGACIRLALEKQHPSRPVLENNDHQQEHHDLVVLLFTAEHRDEEVQDINSVAECEKPVSPSVELPQKQRDDANGKPEKNAFIFVTEKYPGYDRQAEPAEQANPPGRGLKFYARIFHAFFLGHAERKNNSGYPILLEGGVS